MIKLRGKKLSSIYPRQKSSGEIEAEHRILMARRRPKHIAAKLSLWATLCVFIIFITYVLAAYIMSHSLDSSGAVLFGVAASILSVIIIAAILYYICLLISGMIQKVLAAPTFFYTLLLIVSITNGAWLSRLLQNESANFVTVTGVLLLNAVVVYIMGLFVARRAG